MTNTSRRVLSALIALTAMTSQTSTTLAKPIVPAMLRAHAVQVKTGTIDVGDYELGLHEGGDSGSAKVVLLRGHSVASCHVQPVEE